MRHRAARQNLKKLREGHREAYEELICRHYGAIYRFMAHMTRNVGLAEDLTQETFASAWANIGSFKGQASFGTWLHQIAYRKFIDSRRSLERNAALMDRLKQKRPNAPETSDPLHRLMADEHSRILHEAICRLKSAEYVVIVLHYIQGLSFRQVAHVLGEPPGTVKWQTNRALKKLREYLTGGV